MAKPLNAMPSLGDFTDRSSMEPRRNSIFSTGTLGISQSMTTLRDEGLLRAPPARCLDPLHVQMVALSRSDSSDEPRKDDGVQEEPVLWMEPVLIKEEYHMAVVHADRLLLSYIPAQEPIGAMFRGFRRGPLGGGEAITCLPFESVVSVDRVKKVTSAFVDPALNITSRPLSIKDSNGTETVLVLFQESSRLDLHLRSAWLNHVITRTAYSPAALDTTCLPEETRTLGGKRRRARKSQAQPLLRQSAYGHASAYYKSLEAIILSTKDVRECTQLLEELACACLLDLTLKRLFFRSSRLLPRLLLWIDSFRAQATALAAQNADMIKGPLENSLTLNTGGWQGNGAFSETLGSLALLASSHSSMVLLLGRVLACLRLLFAGLYASEGVPERFGPLLGSVASACHVSELVRLLSDDLTDVIRLFDRRTDKTVGQRDNGALSLRIDQWLTQRESAISCLHSTGTLDQEGPLDAMDLFTTLHDLQVCVLGCVSGLLQAYNLDAEAKARVPEEGVGTHLATHARDATVFLKTLISRLITLLQALVPPPAPVDDEDSIQEPEDPTGESGEMGDASSTPACEGPALLMPVTTESPPQPTATVGGAAPTSTSTPIPAPAPAPAIAPAPTPVPAVTFSASEGSGPEKELPIQQPQQSEQSQVRAIEKEQPLDARMGGQGEAEGSGEAEAEWEQAAALLLDPPRGTRGFLQTLRQLRRSSSVPGASTSLLAATSRSSLSSDDLGPQCRPRVERGLSRLLDTTGTFSLTARQVSAADLQEAESRVLGLEALVLHTQPKLSLYWHALLLWHVSMDDYLVREAIRDACHDEIRLYLRPLLAHLRKARAACNLASGATAPSEAQQACGGVLMGCCVDLLQAVVEVIPVD